MSESIKTKKLLASGLKNLMRRKSFDKIYVADITRECDLNRQTFYYHFTDKYELVNWIYYNELISVVTKDRSYEHWADGALEMLNIMKSEQWFYQNTLKITGQNAFADYIFGITKELFLNVVEQMSEGKSIKESDKKFIAEFYSHGIVGVIVSWTQNGMKESPQDVTDHLKNLIDDSKHYAVKRYLKETEK